MKLLYTLKELSKDSFYYGLSSVLSQLISLLLVPFYTRVLDPEIYGIILMLSVIVTFVIPIGGLSLDGAFIRFYSFADENDRRKYFSTSLILKCFGLSISSTFIFLLFDLINQYLFDNKLNEFFIIYIVLMTSFEALSMLFFSLLRVKRQVKKIFYVNLISLAVGLFFSILLVLILKLGLYGAVIATFIGSSVKFTTLSFMIIRLNSFKFSKILYKELINYSLPKIPHKIFAFFIMFSTTLFINEILGLAMAGIYFVSLKLTKPLALITNIFQQAWVPYRLDIHKLKNKKKLFSEITFLYFNTLIFLWLLISIFTPEIYNILIDPKYHKGISYVPFLLLVPISNAFYYMYITGYELHKNQKVIMYASMSVSIIQLFLCYYFMDYFAPYNFIFFHVISFIILGLIIKKWANQIIKFKIRFFEIIVNILATSTVIFIVYNYDFKFIFKILIILLNLSILFFLFKKVMVNSLNSEK